MLDGYQTLDARFQSQTLETSCCQNDRAVLPFIQLAQPCVDIASQGFNFEMWKTCLQLALAAQA